VTIRCRPAGNWLAPSSTTQWLAGVKLFMPPYHALSQACARAGLSLTRCRLTTEAGVPRIELVMTFPSLMHASRCTLFADRQLQWHANRYSVTLLHRIPALPAQFADAPLFAHERDTLHAGTFGLRMVLPGRVTAVEGAQRQGNAIMLALPFDAFAASNGVAVTATARVRLPWWYWGAGCAVVIAACALIAFWYVQTRKRYADSAGTQLSR
jgi:hypothetical protein